MRGGYRKGAGRKKGFSGKSAEEGRRYFAERVAEKLGPLADVLMEKALKGDMKALQLLLERAWGKHGQQTLPEKPEAEAEVSQDIKDITSLINDLLSITAGNARQARRVLAPFLGQLREAAREMAQTDRIASEDSSK